MTCKCPKRWCYARSDCRHLKPALPTEWERRAQRAAARLPDPKGLRVQWLEQRRAELAAELEAGDVGQERPSSRSTELALKAITVALARYQ
jgi:hypothetical protein